MTFEQWWAEHYNQLDHRDICRTSERAWQAATAELVKEIEELKADINSLVYVYNNLTIEVVDINKNLAVLKDTLAANVAMRQVDVNTIAELKAELVEWRDRAEANEGTTHE